MIHRLANSMYPTSARLGTLSLCLAALLGVFCGHEPRSVFAHPPGDGTGESHEHESADEKHPPTIATGLLLPETEGPKPWSDKPALTDPNRFSIAIMTDRTGGHRPGIWMKAVERINWLRPDFVVSVGDLIEGYTEDDAEIDRQWKEFLGFIDRMDMKFFFVPGNHDVTNPKLHEIWRKQFGTEWYSFDYKDVHFVCLNSEDPSGHIGETQLGWLAADLKRNANARWTLMFLHKPIWTYAERDLKAGNADSSNWTKVAEMLGDRPHTVFAGHVHHYVQYVRNGRDYYSLGTTGGSSALRGVAYGEFDHITWLTMEDNGPRVANLLLDGIQPANVVTEDSIQRFREFLQAVRLDVEPIFISGEAIQSGTIRMQLRNGFDQNVSLSGKIEGLPLVGLSLESQTIDLQANPTQSVAKTLKFELKEPVDLKRFQATHMTIKVASSDSPPLRAEWMVPVVIDKEYALTEQIVAVDGDVQEWTQEWWSTGPRPELAGAIQNWQGDEDSSYEVSAHYDAQNLYFAVRVRDERINPQDSLTLQIDTRPQLTRLTSPQLPRDSFISVSIPDSVEPSKCTVTEYRGRAVAGARAAGKQIPQVGYQVELAVPLDKVVAEQGTDWSSLQLGVRVGDADTDQEDLVEVLWRSGQEARNNRPLAHLFRK